MHNLGGLMKRTSLFAALCAFTLATSALADDRVLVLPFNSLNVPAPQQWIAKAVQENLVADLGRTPGVIPISSSSQVIIEDNATAARLAQRQRPLRRARCRPTRR